MGEKNNPDDQNPNDGFLESIRQVILDRIDDPSLSVEDLGKAVHLTRSQVHRRLKEAARQNATMYIRSLRLEKARKLLRETAIPISQIAYEVGFTDAAFFSRVFKEHFRKPPSDFRHEKKK